MSVQDPAKTREPGLATVVAASAAGTAFEWYDFFIFGSLAAVIAKHFYTGVNEATGFILALATFAVGFFVRPLGALVFGHIGDRKGRKGAFLVTISLMGIATFAIGFLPTYEQIGMAAPLALIALRVLQGFALGGEYGGAAIYVAEHAPAKKRGGLTGWIQTSAALGLIGALVVILVTRKTLGEEAFQAWGWRIPFWVSMGLLLISLWMRVKLGESPAFRKLEAEEGAVAKAPFAESFLRWRNLRLVLIVLFGIMMAQGAVWYAAFFYSQFFLEKVLKVEAATVNELMIAATLASAVLYVVFGWLSDKIGRKPVMLFGMILATVAFFPAFKAITAAANPALAEAQAKAPVVVHADPATCSVQFDPVGKAVFASSCDIAKSVLTNAGVSYSNAPLAPGETASVSVGERMVLSREGAGLDGAALKALKAEVEVDIRSALAEAGYPEKADPARIDFQRLFGLMMIFVVAATALYGPQAAALVELFPTRIRYTAMSLPYNIGTGWFGGFLPAAAFAMVAASGNIFFGLWYPVAITAVAVLVNIAFLPETKGRDLDKIET
ncbi:MFS transporter [Caulobacter sp. 17J65-9]|uniref:MFS transporter n=1 Tax=Caulobacter sp. 17J65-9 TaxID=2709382 RepID=UPI0013CC72F7|nr:MFS transporter [Caulobacter sp. 17J65-9]NEX94820.1 MHS family MFS transporter [Caulobacter sp. 17J65-9]